MGLWSVYFLGKIFLYLWGTIRFSVLPNLLFAAFLAVPVPKTLPLYRVLKSAKLGLSFLFAFLLLWYDSYFPPLLYTISTFQQIGLPEKEYIYRFVMNTLNPIAVLALLFILVLCIFLNRRIKLAPVVVLLMLIVPLFGLTRKDVGIEEYLTSFYQSESKRMVSFEQPEKKAPDFDILILHVCSLSWDDLRTVGFDTHPFLRKFDILFTNFNSVSSYTNPSAIRLLRANCGQQKHEAIYREAPKECFLLESLRSLEYQTYTAIDNDAPAYRFVEDIMNHGKADAPISLKGIPVQQYDFDKTPIHNDLQILERWWDMRQKSDEKRAALYFDITTLHGGAHWAHEKDWWKRDRPTHYKEFLLNLFANLEKFFQRISASGRNFVVVFVPEHGMALRGSSIQAPDLRDIPLPQITNIPVGIKFIGQGFQDTPIQQEIIAKPTSYLALSWTLSLLLKEPPFSREGRSLRQYLEEVPETRFVAENQEALVVRRDQAFYLYGKEKTWTKLPSSAIR